MQIRKLHILYALISCTLLVWTKSAFACPTIAGLVDFNCDRKHQIVGVGDSVVYGYGDKEFNDRGGYLTRLKPVFRKSKIYKEGFPGITVSRLLAYYKSLFRSQPKHPLIQNLGKADILIIDVGRNDFFNRNTSSVTVETLKRLSNYLKIRIKSKFGTSPLIVGAELIPSGRELDRTFIEEIDSMLFKMRSGDFPFYLRFDLLDPMLISEDGIHPTSEGYIQMAALAQEYISDDAQERSRNLRVDNDGDGVYDIFEKSKFKTNPKLADTDGDNILDGDEIFVYKTDPLVANELPK